jgi:tRNA-dihydrouridine synthase B
MPKPFVEPMNLHPANFYIGGIPVHGDLVLAPMDGFSDLPFRSLVRELGSALSYTEFINIQDVLSEKKSLEFQLQYLPEERPVVYQIYDDDPKRLLKGVLKLRGRNPDIIDINMGCSAKSVAGRGAGAGLLKQPEKIGEIFREISLQVDIPLTGKIRLGWDQQSKNYLDIARIIEENGGKMVAVHARTRSQDYRQRADWDAIGEIKRAVSIPVIGNGDISCVADIEKMKTHTGCDAVMIGRAAISNPWIFMRLDRDQVSPKMESDFIFAHLQRMLDFYGEENGLRRFRKFEKSYLQPYLIDADEMRNLLTITQPEALRGILSDILDNKKREFG